MLSNKRLFSLLCLFLTLLLSEQRGLQAEARLQQDEERQQLNNFRPTKLFVFGDSYADTGNTKKRLSVAWEDPYGITFPGKPAGRASDGRLLTDYIATYLGIKSPLPYELRKLNPQYLKYGVNFAYGGSGVFDTNAAAPNMTTQIDFFQQLIRDNVYSTTDLSYSVALVSVAGNDYGGQVLTKGFIQDLPSYITSVVNQITTNLIRIHGLGVKKIAVTGLGPLGCVPLITAASSFQQCNDTLNTFVTLHDTLLNQTVAKLNQEAKDHSTFVVLDLYSSFMSALNHPSVHNFIQNPLKPCCVGVSSEYLCGNVDANKVKKYHVCDDPKSAFFWDIAHPTQAGWNAVYNELRTTNALQYLKF